MDTLEVYGQEVDGELQKVANILDRIFNTILKCMGYFAGYEQKNIPCLH